MKRRYVIDYELSLYASRIVLAESEEEAKRKAEELMREEPLWSDLVDEWHNSDWIPENVEAIVYSQDDDCEFDHYDVIGEE